jgi:hypothetical protein
LIIIKLIIVFQKKSSISALFYDNLVFASVVTSEPVLKQRSDEILVAGIDK